MPPRSWIAVGYLGRWAAISFFVVLLTVIFSFLGTIICAVLAGMMMGATRHSRWQALPIAGTFPAVIFTVLRGSRAQLLERQIIVLAALCFGAFWVTYLVTGLVIWYERKQVSLNEENVAMAPGNAAAVDSAGQKSSVGALSLEVLQGEWVRVDARGKPLQTKVSIEENRVSLSGIGEDGVVQKLAEGKIELGEE